MTMTRGGDFKPRIRLRTSRPFSFGRPTSRRTRLNFSFSRRRRADTPSPTPAASSPLSRSISTRTRFRPRSSSTTSTAFKIELSNGPVPELVLFAPELRDLQKQLSADRFRYEVLVTLAHETIHFEQLK